MSVGYWARRTRVLIATAVLSTALAGCAGLPTQSFVSPSADGTSYDGFLAYGAFSDLAVEGAYEKALCRHLLAAGHACNTMLALVPPTVPQTGDSRQRAALKSGAQAVVIVELADPKAASRRILDDGRPGYRVTLTDAQKQKLMARFAIDDGRSRNLSERADALADAVVQALRRRKLLQQRS